MTKKTSSKKSSARSKSLTKKFTPQKTAPSQMEAMGHAPGARVKCIVDMGHVGAGAMGKITQVVPEASASVVRFDGASHDTLLALTHVQVIGYAPGDRVRCTINIGPVLAGTPGTVKESIPQADASAVEFDTTPGETALVPNTYLEPV